MSQTRVKLKPKKVPKSYIAIPTAEEIATYSRKQSGMDLPSTIEAMRFAIAVEDAHAAVCVDGKGCVIVDTTRGSHTYVRGGTDDDLMQTDDLVLVFDDVIAELEGSRDRTPYIDPSRTDLCPNIKHVHLCDYSNLW